MQFFFAEIYPRWQFQRMHRFQFINVSQSQNTETIDSVSLNCFLLKYMLLTFFALDIFVPPTLRAFQAELSFLPSFHFYFALSVIWRVFSSSFHSLLLPLPVDVVEWCRSHVSVLIGVVSGTPGAALASPLPTVGSSPSPLVAAVVSAPSAAVGAFGVAAGVGLTAATAHSTPGPGRGFGGVKQLRTVPVRSLVH